MAKFSYKGYDFEVDHTPTAEEFAQMSAHVDTLPPKGQKAPGYESQIPAGKDTTPTFVPEPTLEDKVKGMGEAALNFGTSAVAGTVGPLVGAAKRITGGSMKDAEKSAADTMEALTYAPRTAKGQDYTENVGEVVNKYLMPIAPLIHGVPQVQRGPRSVREAPVDRPSNVSRAEQMLAEQDRPPVPQGQQMDMFGFDDTAGQATPYNAGQAGVTEPVAPLRARRQQELPLENGVPGTAVTDRNGVITKGLPDEGTRLARDRAEQGMVDHLDEQYNAQRNKDFLGAKQEEMFGDPSLFEMERNGEVAPREVRPVEGTQGELFGEKFDLAPDGEMAPRVERELPTEGVQGDLFEPYTNSHREFDQFGNDRKTLTFDEYKATVENLKNEPSTRYEAPKNLKDGYQQYLDSTREKQGGLFDAPSKENAFQEALYQDTVPARVQEHPFVKKANERVAKAEALVEKLQKDVEAGKIVPTILMRTERDLATLKAKQAEVASNVETALRKKEEPVAPKGFKASKTANKQRGAVRFDWGNRKNEELLKGVPGLKEKLKDILPDTRTNKEFLAQEAGTKDVDQNMLQKGFNYLTKGGVYQTLKTHNPLVKRVVDRVLDADNSAKALIGQVVHDSYAPALRKLSKQEMTDVGAIINVMDKEAKSLSVEQLRELGMNDKQLKAIEIHQKAMDITYNQMAKAMEAAGVTPVSKRTAYAAFRARGDFRKVFYDGVDAKGNPVPIGIVGSNTRFGLERDVKRLKEKFPDATVGEERYYGGTTNHTGTEAGYGQALELMAKDNPAMREFIDALNDLVSQDAFNYMDAKKHTMAKKGVWGMEGRNLLKTVEQNSKDMFEAQTRNMETMIKWGELSKAVEEVKPLLDKDNGLNMPMAKEYLRDYVDNAMGINPTAVGRAIENLSGAFGKASGLGVTIPTKIASAAKSVTNGILLGFLNVPFLVTNMIQPFKVMPEMKAWMESKGLKTSFDAGTGYSALGKAAIDMYKEKAGKPLSEITEGALKYAKDNHVYSSDLFEAGNSVTKGVDHYWTKGSQMGAAQIEQFTRKNFFLATVNMLHENGLKPSDGLYQAARRITDMGMNNYSHVEAPMAYNAMGGLGKMAYNLVSYKHNELSRLSMFGRELVTDKAAKPLAVSLMSQIAFAGIKGTILYQEADWIIRHLSEQMGTPTSLSKILLESKIPDVMKFGMFSAAGVDTTSRLGLTVTPDGLGGALFPGGSKLAEGIGSVATAATNPTEFNLKNAARDIAPLSVTGAMDRAWFSGKDAQGNELSMNRKKLEANAVRNDADKAWKSIGATGINESTQKSRRYENDQIDQAYQDRRMSITKDMAQRFFVSNTIDKDLVQKYIKAQGDPATLARDIQTFATKQRVPAQTLQLLRDASSSSITALYRAQREAQK